MARTLEQKRAALAWDKIEEISGKQDKVQREYRSSILKAPAMIMTSGLGPTLAFLKSRGEGAEELLYDHLSGWLKSEDAPIAWSSSKHNLIERVVAEDSVVYRQVAQEALAFVTWLKRFAQARLKKEGGSS